MSLPTGNFGNTIRTRVTEIRTTIRARIDQVRARVQSMGFGGLIGQAPIKTYSRRGTSGGFARPGGIISRWRQTRQQAPTTVPKPGIKSFTRPPQSRQVPRPAPIKTFSKKDLRAPKTF